MAKNTMFVLKSIKLLHIVMRRTTFETKGYCDMPIQNICVNIIITCYVLLSAVSNLEENDMVC